MSNQDQIPQVRLALKDDLSNIVDFNISMALETENITLNKNEITQGVQAVFDDPHLGRYCIATIKDQKVGGLLLTTEWSDCERCNCPIFCWVPFIYEMWIVY